MSKLALVLIVLLSTASITGLVQATGLGPVIVALAFLGALVFVLPSALLLRVVMAEPRN